MLTMKLENVRQYITESVKFPFSFCLEDGAHVPETMTMARYLESISSTDPKLENNGGQETSEGQKPPADDSSKPPVSKQVFPLY